MIQCTCNSCMNLFRKGPEQLTLFLIDRPLGHCNFTDLKRKIFYAWMTIILPNDLLTAGGPQ